MKNRLFSFKYALSGIGIALKEEPNMVIHLLISAFVLFLAWFFLLSFLEWVLLIFAIGLVLSLELTNTAIEEVVNSLTEKSHPAAKKAKDVAAGAVLVGTITAILIGLIVFVPHLIPSVGY